MQPNLMKKPCPVCKTKIRAGLFNHREEIIRCPNCGALLIDNPKRKLAGMLIGMTGLVLWAILSLWFVINLPLLFLLIFIPLFISMLIWNFSVIKKDLAIRNKQTNMVSYVNKSDWDEIVKNSPGKENIFEIIEEL